MVYMLTILINSKMLQSFSKKLVVDRTSGNETIIIACNIFAT